MSNRGKRKRSFTGIRRRYSFFALGLLVCISVPLWIFFSASRGDSTYQRARLVAASKSGDSSLERGLLSDDADNGSSFISVASDSFLDPDPKKIFLVSFVVSPERLSEEERVFKMIGKYEVEKPPYVGWAVALRIRNDSVRIESYWKGVSGGGGWFSFDEFKVVSDRSYSVSLFARSEEYISMYVQELAFPSAGQSAPSSTDDFMPEKNVIFAGGYPVAKIDLEATSGDLFISSQGKGGGDSSLRVREVLIARPLIDPSSRLQVQAFLTGGPTAIAERMDSNEISLWIDQSAKDRSRFHRNLASLGERS